MSFMRTSWKIGRIAGIDFYIHPTFLLVLAWIFGFSGGFEGVLLFSLVFVCVALHEYGHALMAKRFGYATESITLYPIGGVARMLGLPKSPGAEILVALAGPAVNFAIALVLGSLLGFSATAATSDGLRSSLMWNLLAANIFLGLFNLLPAFPMDGGRVLRALLSGWLGRVRATEIAAGIGRALAVVFGLFILFSSEATVLKFVHIAMASFIFTAGGAELASVRNDDRRRRQTAAPTVIETHGYQWIQQPDGVWRLAPAPAVVVEESSLGRGARPWI
jgi:Zn-dependent protease